MDSRLAQRIKMYKTYLAKNGIPYKKANEIMQDLGDIAIEETKDLQMNRIFTAMAFAINTHFEGIDAQDIIGCLTEFGNLMEGFQNGVSWLDIAQTLKDETGIVIRSEGEHYYVDYLEDDLK